MAARGPKTRAPSASGDVDAITPQADADAITPQADADAIVPHDETADASAGSTDGASASATPLRRSTRVRRPPQPPFASESLPAPRGTRRTVLDVDGTSSSGEHDGSRLDQIAVADGGAITVSMHPAAAIIMQLHAHLSRTEIIGYCAGFRSADGKHVRILEAFPAKALAGSILSRTGRNALREVEMDPESEVEVRVRIMSKGLGVVGWYHSHPDKAFTVEPSHVDVENQRNFQTHIMQGSAFVGAILAPYNFNLPDKRGDMAVFYSGKDFPFRIPYTIEYGVDGAPAEYVAHLRGRTVCDDAVEDEGMKLVHMYCAYRQRVQIFREWRPNITYLDKVRVCMLACLPNVPGEQGAGAAGIVANGVGAGPSPAGGPSSTSVARRVTGAGNGSGAGPSSAGMAVVNGSKADANAAPKLSQEEIEENEIIAQIMQAEAAEANRETAGLSQEEKDIMEAIKLSEAAEAAEAAKKEGGAGANHAAAGDPADGKLIMERMLENEAVAAAEEANKEEEAKNEDDDVKEEDAIKGADAENAADGGKDSKDANDSKDVKMKDAPSETKKRRPRKTKKKKIVESTDEEADEEEEEEEDCKIEILRPGCGVVQMGPVSDAAARESNELLTGAITRVMATADDAWVRPKSKTAGTRGKRRRRRY